MSRLIKADRLTASKEGVRYIRYFDDFVAQSTNNVWTDVGTAVDKKYVVETGPTVIQRCILMTTDPGDLVLDPTCGSGTTAYVAEQWGRRWITIDTSRVALALARARIMGARYLYYVLADSPEGQRKEAELRNLGPANTPTRNDIRQGFVYERVPHITLKSIANNAEIDVIWDDYQIRLESLRERLNLLLKRHWQEWEIPYECSEKWLQEARDVHAEWWLQRIARQKAIDSSIAAKAELENLYDRPYEDKAKVRVAGPFTVESLSPHRMLAIEDDDLASSATSPYDEPRDAGNFVQVILDTLQASGVQQADKNARITFDTLQPWPGSGYICAEGRYTDDDGRTKRAGVLIGPEFGTITRHDLVLAAREAGDANFDVVIACGFNFDAQTTEFNTLGRIRILKARMNADLHMAEDLKNTGKGNLFVIFGEPDIEIQPGPHDEISVKVNGIDVFHPGTGQVTSSEPKDLACWFIDTDYNDESFFVRHAYFLGANDPYKSLQTTLRAEINPEAWESLRSDKSRPFSKPITGRIAVKVINHLGDEVMKVFTVR
jgi:adenine-specific DNA-methyltransferase